MNLAAFSCWRRLLRAVGSSALGLLSLGGGLVVTFAQAPPPPTATAVESYLHGPGWPAAPALTLHVGGYPVDVRVPAAGGLSYLREQLGVPEVAAELQRAVDAHARDFGVGPDGDENRYRLRVLVRGAQDYASELNGRARELHHRTLEGEAAAKARSVTLATRRDAAITLATWAMLDLFRAEGGALDAASLNRRAADLAVGVDWERVERLLLPVLAAGTPGTGGLETGPATAGTPGAGGARGRPALAQSITFQRAEGEPGREGAGVEVFTWHPNPSQLNRGTAAVRVRVDMPSAEAGMAPWTAVRGALPAEAFSPASYAALDATGRPAEVLAGLLRVARTIQGAAAAAYRRELLAAAGGERERYRYWRARATQAEAPAGCPPRVRAAAGSYLAANYWAEGLRTALAREAGPNAALAVGPAPDPGLLLPGEAAGDDL